LKNALKILGWAIVTLVVVTTVTVLFTFVLNALAHFDPPPETTSNAVVKGTLQQATCEGYCRGANQTHPNTSVAELRGHFYADGSQSGFDCVCVPDFVDPNLVDVD